MSEAGCRCQFCGQRYRVDLLVPDALWNRIRPVNASPHGGLLCGRCIVDRIERLEKFDAIELRPIEREAMWTDEDVEREKAIRVYRREVLCEAGVGLNLAKETNLPSSWPPSSFPVNKN